MNVRSILAAAGLALAVSGGNADAAPQVLGVMSSAQPTVQVVPSTAVTAPKRSFSSWATFGVLWMVSAPGAPAAT